MSICGIGINACSVPVNRDFTGNRLPAAPTFSMSTNIEVDIPLDRLGTLSKHSHHLTPTRTVGQNCRQAHILLPLSWI